MESENDGAPPGTEKAQDSAAAAETYISITNDMRLTPGLKNKRKGVDDVTQSSLGSEDVESSRWHFEERINLDNGDNSPCRSEIDRPSPSTTLSYSDPEIESKTDATGFGICERNTRTGGESLKKSDRAVQLTRKHSFPGITQGGHPTNGSEGSGKDAAWDNGGRGNGGDWRTHAREPDMEGRNVRQRVKEGGTDGDGESAFDGDGGKLLLGATTLRPVEAVLEDVEAMVREIERTRDSMRWLKVQNAILLDRVFILDMQIGTAS